MNTYIYFFPPQASGDPPLKYLETPYYRWEPQLYYINGKFPFHISVVAILLLATGGSTEHTSRWAALRSGPEEEESAARFSKKCLSVNGDEDANVGFILFSSLMSRQKLTCHLVSLSFQHSSTGESNETAEMSRVNEEINRQFHLCLLLRHHWFFFFNPHTC